MKVDVLLGLQWGDEGKGKVVDVLTPNYDIITSSLVSRAGQMPAIHWNSKAKNMFYALFLRVFFKEGK